MQTIWLVGDSDEGCFAPAVEWLAAHTSLQRMEDLKSALQGVEEHAGHVDGLVVCASRPGKIDPETIESIHRFEPLARTVLLLGSWCEGEVRSGRILPGAKRVYWHQWRSALPLALGKSEIAPPLWLPRTATEGDWLEGALALSNTRQHQVVAVRTHRSADFDWIADALTAGGFEAVWHSDSKQSAAPAPAVMLWDGWPSDHSVVKDCSKRCPQVLLLNFPRFEDRQRARAIGFFEIVSRPLQLTELWATLDAAIETNQAANKPVTSR